MIRLLLRVSLLLALGLGVAVGVALALDTGGGALLAFISNRDGRHNMYLHDPRTGRTMALPGTSDLTYDLAWSPVSRWFGYSRWTAGNVEVFIHDIERRETVNISEHEADDTGLYWSSDGEQVVFVSERDGNLDIYGAAVGGGEPVNLTDHAADDFSPVWSPDGTRLAFVSNRNENGGLRRDGLHGLYLLAPDSGAVQHLLSGPGIDSLVWSPDGAWLALVLYNERRWDVVVVDSVTGEAVRVAEDAFLPVWSPDGAWLAFAGPAGRQSGRGAVSVARVGNWQAEVVYTNDERYEYLAWSPDSRWLAVGNFSTQAEHRIVRGIRLLDMQDGGEVSISTSRDYDVYPVWSPDGRWLAFTSWRDGNSEAYVWDMQNGTAANISQHHAEDVLPTWVFGPDTP